MDFYQLQGRRILSVPWPRLSTTFPAMTIWILALLCAGLAAYAGYARGVIRAALGLLGILLGLALAPALGGLLVPVMRAMISNILLADALAPLAVFLIIALAFVGVGQAVHKKVEVHFRYKATDTRLLHWERLMARMGAALGLLNGTMYFYVLCTVIYVGGYLTTQVTTPENSTATTSFVNRVAADLNASGMEKAIVAIDPMPAAYYDAADIVGQVFHNRLLISRLTRYPAFLGMAERPEFQDIGTDPEVLELFTTQASLGQLVAHPKIKALLSNALIIDEFKTVDMADLKEFVETGKSPKYEPVRILGRWTFDFTLSMEQTFVAQPNMKARRKQELNAQLGLSLIDSTLTATPDNQVYIKSVPPQLPQPGQPMLAPSGPPVVVGSGTWATQAGEYTINFNNPHSSPFYQYLTGPAKVRFLDDSLFIEFSEIVLCYSIEF